MKYGLFLGCNMPAIRPDVERAMRLTMPELGVEVLDLEGCACCPAYGTFPSADEVASLATSAWNLSIADEKGVDLLIECGSCYSILRLGRAKLLGDEETRSRVNALLGAADKTFVGSAIPRHVIDVLYNDVGPERIGKSITRRLEGVNAVVQYPCHTLWPSETVGFDDPGKPHMLGELVEALGANVQSYSREFQCCGGAGGFARRSHGEAVGFVKRKFDAIKQETQADLIVVSCVTCLMHLDKVQPELGGEDSEYAIPVFDYSQILALCMGFAPQEVAGIAVTPRDRIFEICAAAPRAR